MYDSGLLQRHILCQKIGLMDPRTDRTGYDDLIFGLVIY